MGWYWNVEGAATVSDDASNWTVMQTVVGLAKGYSVINGYLTPFTAAVTDGNGGPKTDGPKPNYLQQPSGQKTIYWLDAPGLAKPYDSLMLVYNFVTTYCTNIPAGNCTPIHWYLRLVVKPGGTLDPTQSRVALGTDWETF